MPIQLNGLVSGLDTQNIVNQLMQLERMPLTKVQGRQQVLKWRKEMLNEFKTKLLDLQSKVSALTLSSAFTVKKVSPSDESVVTATATASAANGTYNINATLAEAYSYISTASVGFSNGTAATFISTGEMNSNLAVSVDPNAKFNDGAAPPQFDAPYNVVGAVHAGSFNINDIIIDVTDDDTINLVINKINSNSLTGVTASLSGDTITLTQKTIGATPTIAVTGDTSGFVAATKLDGAIVTAGTDTGYTSELDTTGLGFTSGTFTINGYTFTVDTATESAQDIVNKINSATASGVTAFFDTVSKKLTITKRDTGNTDITWGSAFDTSNFLAAMNIDVTGAAGRTMGSDAAVTINGADITRTSNTFEYNGVTFTLKENGSATVTVNTDSDKIITSIKDFVNSYNTAIDYINSKLGEKTVTKPVSDADKKLGILNSDYLLKSTLTNMRNNIMNTVNGLPANYNQLALIGISTGDSSTGIPTGLGGKLVIDETKLKNALAADPTSVQNLFMKAGSGSDAGVAVRIKEQMETLTKFDGLVDIKIGSSGSLTREITNMNAQIKRMEEQLEMRESRLWRQFTSMEKALSTLKNQGSWLSSQLASLSQ